MKCLYCGAIDSRVLDSRPAEEGSAIRRRRECGECGRRFTTYERVDELPLLVVKKDGRREPFDRSKLMTGLITACQKRPITTETVVELVNAIEGDLKSAKRRELPSKTIGEQVMQRLRELDEVAYVRFASVYREFRDVGEFVREIQQLASKKTDLPQ